MTHGMLSLQNQEAARSVPDPFPPFLGVGPGTETTCQRTHLMFPGTQIFLIHKDRTTRINIPHMPQ